MVARFRAGSDVFIGKVAKNIKARQWDEVIERVVVRRTVIKHGTLAGYNAEHRLGRERCWDCRTAYAAYRRKKNYRAGIGY